MPSDDADAHKEVELPTITPVVSNADVREAVDVQEGNDDGSEEPVEQNDEGAAVHPGAFIPGYYFCGREPEDESRNDGGDRADGATRCGPMYGDQCTSCQRYQALNSAPK